MANNKVQLADGTVIIDITDTTAEAEDVASGSVFYSADGTRTVGTMSSGISLLDVYPVGSIYISVDSTSPASLFGGTWEQIKDTFLLSAGDTYTAGNTGGAKTHTHTTGGHILTTSEIPSHTHGSGSTTHGFLRAGAIVRNTAAKGDPSTGWTYVMRSTETTVQSFSATAAAGGGGSHSHGNTGSTSNMPPYLAVYVWKRTA